MHIMISTAVVFAAGRGKRMKQLTTHAQKVVLSVNGKPFLWYVVNNLVAAGITRIIVVVGHYDTQVRAFVDAYADDFLVEFVILDSEIKGTLEPIWISKPQLDTTQSFLALNGDNLFAVEDVQAMMKLDAGQAAIAVSHIGEEQQYGALFFDDKMLLTHIQHKDDPPLTTLPQAESYNNTGMYVLPSKIWEVIDQVEPAASGEYRITDALLLLREHPGVRQYILQGPWYDFGKPDDIQAVEHFLQ